jgi:hypothetical protein
LVDHTTDINLAELFETEQSREEVDLSITNQLDSTTHHNAEVANTNSQSEGSQSENGYSAGQSESELDNFTSGLVISANQSGTFAETEGSMFEASTENISEANESITDKSTDIAAASAEALQQKSASRNR